MADPQSTVPAEGPPGARQVKDGHTGPRAGAAGILWARLLERVDEARAGYERQRRAMELQRTSLRQKLERLEQRLSDLAELSARELADAEVAAAQARVRYRIEAQRYWVDNQLRWPSGWVAQADPAYGVPGADADLIPADLLPDNPTLLRMFGPGSRVPEFVDQARTVTSQLSEAALARLVQDPFPDRGSDPDLGGS